MLSHQQTPQTPHKVIRIQLWECESLTWVERLVSLALLALIFRLASASSSRFGASYLDALLSGLSGSLSLRDSTDDLLPAAGAPDAEPTEVLLLELAAAAEDASPEEAAAAASALAASYHRENINIVV